MYNMYNTTLTYLLLNKIHLAAPQVPNNNDSDLCQSFSSILQYIPYDTAQNKPLVMSIEPELHRTLRGQYCKHPRW